MTSDHDMQSTESTDIDRAASSDSISRRHLLQSTAVGLIGLVGSGTSETVSATKTTTQSPSNDETMADPGGCDTAGADKLLRVKGMGTGLNAYHIETSETITPTGGIASSLEQTGDTIIEGTIRKDHVESHCFTGRVTAVYAQGSVIYYVSE